MRALSARRPELLLLAALAAFALVSIWRGMQPAELSPSAPVAPITQTDPRAVGRLQERLRANPDDHQAAASLGLALLLRVRETGDAGLYDQAEQAFEQALRANPQQLDAMIGQGALALARHEFADALAWGERAQALAPQRAAVYGVLTDAYVELGRYEEAVAAAQRMVDLRPDLDSYSRVSYLRELHGDRQGAIQAMELAAEAGAHGAENTAWCYTQLGNLYLAGGELERAIASYQLALFERPAYPHAEAGLARVLAAQGELPAAAQQYEALVERVPLPEFAIFLGDLYRALGRDEAAARQDELVGALQRLNAAAGMNVDLELALFEADHGDPAAALEKARSAYALRPSVAAADALAWAAFRAGDQETARRHSIEALRLGSFDPAMHLRAGLIAADADPGAARSHLTTAVAGAAMLTPVQAAAARDALARLP